VWRGRRLVASPGRTTRPTSDRVREAVFDVLGALPQLRTPETGEAGSGVLSSQVVLDLYAGSGGLGIEALSRGARRCTFVEKDRSALRALHVNLEGLGLDLPGEGIREPSTAAASAARVRVIRGDVRAAFAADARRGSKYTLVFADPPYDKYEEVRPALARLLRPLLAAHAVVVLETAARTNVELPWTVVREKNYGGTRVTFMVVEEHREGEGAMADEDVARHDHGEASGAE
jgi:16S rRNA (guanine966-N2)-methyltransferase